MNALALPAVTILSTAILALVAASLSIWVIVQRVRLKVEWGDGNKPAMAQAVRAHANFAEHVPIALLAIGASEVAGTSRLVIIGLAAALIVARLLSAYGLIRSLGPSLPRQVGASISIAVTIVASLTALWMSARLLRP